MVLVKPAQNGEHPEKGNTVGKAYMLIKTQKEGGELMEDLTGKKFEKWTVIERAYDSSKSKGAKWLCECECGNKKIVWGKYLRNGKSQSCGCVHKRDWIGERFGKLTVIDIHDVSGNDNLVCKCDCGNIIPVSRQ